MRSGIGGGLREADTNVEQSRRGQAPRSEGDVAVGTGTSEPAASMWVANDLAVRKPPEVRARRRRFVGGGEAKIQGDGWSPYEAVMILLASDTSKLNIRVRGQGDRLTSGALRGHSDTFGSSVCSCVGAMCRATDWNTRDVHSAAVELRLLQEATQLHCSCRSEDKTTQSVETAICRKRASRAHCH